MVHLSAGEQSRMSTRVKLLVGHRNGRFPYSNCLLLESASRTVLVDSGCGAELIANIKNKIDAVVYTHIHPDHIIYHELLGSVKTIIPEYDCQYRTLQELAKRFAPPIWREWINYVDRVFGLHSVPNPTECFKGWDVIRVGDIEITAIPATGHTKGHHVFVIEDHVHVSDIDLTGFGPWYGHPESSLTGFISDIDLVSRLEGRWFTTSHKEVVYDREGFLEALTEFRRSLCRQIVNVARHLHESGSWFKPKELINKKLIYIKKIEVAEAVMDYFEYEIIWKILDYLVSIGIVSRSKRGYRFNGTVGELWEKCTKYIIKL